MAELLIRDEHIARRLLNLANARNRSVETILDEMLASYETSSSPEFDPDELVRRVKNRNYAKARHYWESVGDSERLALSDAELDEQFWLFDSEDIPRLKSDEGKFELLKNTLHELARLADEANIQFIRRDDPNVDYDEILNTEFSEYLWRRNQGNYGAEEDIDG